MSLKLVSTPSPNCAPRSRGAEIDILLVHYTGMWTAEDALARLCDPSAKVSAHYLIGEAGEVFALVEENRCAWHAGVSFWAGETDINSRSIGIELVNRGHDLGYHDFSEAQMAAFIELAGTILSRHPIPPHRVLAHSDVAPTRKMDPGERFDWARCAAAGIGLYPPEGLPKPGGPADQGAFLADLARFGYDPGHDEPGRNAAVDAFRRHFHGHAVGFGPVPGVGDRARLAWLLDRLPAA